MCVLWCADYISVIKKRLREENYLPLSLDPGHLMGGDAQRGAYSQESPCPPTRSPDVPGYAAQGPQPAGARGSAPVTWGGPADRGSGRRKETVREGHSGLGGPCSCRAARTHTEGESTRP